MLHKLRLGARIFLGFALVLVLLCVVVLVGYQGLLGVTSGVERADEVNRLAKEILQVRQHEKNFIIRGKDEYAAKVREGSRQLLNQAAAIKEKFDVASEQMDEVTRAVNNYIKAFDDYVALAREKESRMEEMGAAAQVALQQCEAIRADQNAELDKAQTDSQAALKGMVAKVIEATQIVKLFLEARRVEKEFIISNGDEMWKVDLKMRMRQIHKLAQDFKAGFKAQSDLEQIEKLTAAIQQYHEAFDAYAKATEKRRELMTLMDSKARTTMGLLEEIEASQKSQLAQGRKDATKTRAELDIFLEDKMAKAELANRLIGLFLTVQKNVKEFVMSNGDERWGSKVTADIAKILKIGEELRSKFKAEEVVAQISEAIAAVNSFERAFDQYATTMEMQREIMADMGAATGQLIDMVEGIQNAQQARLTKVQTEAAIFIQDKMSKAHDAERMVKLFLEARQNEKEFIISGGVEQWKTNVDDLIGKLLAIAADLDSRFKGQENKDQIVKLTEAVKKYDEAFDAFAAMMAEQGEAERRMLAAASQADKACNGALADQKSVMETQMISSKSLMIGAAVLGIVLGLLMAWIITRGITKPIGRIITGLNAGADQVAAAAGEVSGASQQLAEGAAEQAAALEETTSSMEEMGSMTRANADNASQADSVMTQAKGVVAEAGQAMEETAEAMTQIAEAGAETSKIVKSIDEIAFQTNLLALNAAVEAARAGEAGQGFAVVADEVRNLAMRAAEAARNTQELVEGTARKIEQGSGLVEKTLGAFKRQSEMAGQVATLISEIAAASSEQAQGIDQVNKAMGQMDQVTQQVAANAEESAAASEEMAAQAEQMKEIVGELIALMGGRGEALERGWRRKKKEKDESETEGKLLPPPAETEPQPPSGEVSPEEVIPFDEDSTDDLAEF